MILTILRKAKIQNSYFFRNSKIQNFLLGLERLNSLICKLFLELNYWTKIEVWNITPEGSLLGRDKIFDKMSQNKNAYLTFECR